jgi:hypothetical protein
MSNIDEEYLEGLAREVDGEIAAREVVDKLLEQAKNGDTESVKLLVELGTEAKAVRLRKELFGV